MFRVHDRTPLVLRGFTLFFSITSLIGASFGHIHSCRLGKELDSSVHQINFVIATAAMVILGVVLRIYFFDIKKRQTPHAALLVIFDTVYIVMTFIAAVAASLSPVSNEVCTNDDLRMFYEKVCQFSCANVNTSIVTTFLAFFCFLVSILFTTGVLTTSETTEPVEDFTFGEVVSTPKVGKPSRAIDLS